MPYWNFYFWSTLVITFLITAITARIPPSRASMMPVARTILCPSA